MLLYQIGLTLLPGVGDVLGKKLVAYCGGVEAVFRQKKSALEKIPGIGEKLVTAILSQNVLSRAEEEISFIEKNHITTLFYLEKKYPGRLKNCIDGPIMLYYKGNAEFNTQKVISIVGTRKATEYGREMCDKIVKGLREHGVLVVSGLAYGIDTCVHRASLEQKLKTVAVLGHGLDRLYPYLNTSLSEKILDQGGLITEFMSKTKPDRENFPRRNRIIAGLADATLVVEAAKSGGALITAEIANSYNRDVFSVPGRIGDSWSEGCNFLIKTNKAHLIQSAQDIAYIMGWQKSNEIKPKIQRELFLELTPDEERIADVLRMEDMMGIDDICLKTNLPTSKVSATLLNLEFQGLVRVLPGKVYKLEM
ncbi:MAG: DNA-processing protein DprA [Bacteroidales bacterium]|nr:DNA-processing protein DprA [Bacteroidales bacterium]